MKNAVSPARRGRSAAGLGLCLRPEEVHPPDAQTVPRTIVAATSGVMPKDCQMAAMSLFPQGSLPPREYFMRSAFVGTPPHTTELPPRPSDLTIFGTATAALSADAASALPASMRPQTT